MGTGKERKGCQNGMKHITVNGVGYIRADHVDKTIQKNKPKKPVVWVRKTCFVDGSFECYDLCSPDGKTIRFNHHIKELDGVREIFEAGRVDVEVRIWQEAGPEWVYAIRALPEQQIEAHHLQKLLDGNLRNLVIGLSSSPMAPPQFGIRKLTEGETDFKSEIIKYGAYRNGKYILGTFGEEPEHCIRITLNLLTPAQPAVKLEDLETVISDNRR